MFLNFFTRTPDARQGTVAYSAQWEADNGNYADAAAVSPWSDIVASGSGVNATQATAAQKPTFAIGSDGTSYLDFDGADSLGTIAIPFAYDCFYAVASFSPDGVPAAVERIFDFRNGTTAGFDLRIRGDGTLAAYTFSAGIYEVGVTSSAVTAGAHYVASIYADANGAEFKVNGDVIGAHSTAFVFDTATTNHLGAADASGTEGFDGKIYSMTFMGRIAASGNMPGPAWRQSYERHLLNTRRSRFVTA